MKARNSKKGFTIVELVITIAVIGVLTAILIPTFMGLTQKANEKSDDSLVANLNKALAIHEAKVGDEKNFTCYDAIRDLWDEGYRADVLVTKSDKTLVWYQKDNRFHLANGNSVEGVTGEYNLVDFWGIYNAMPSTQTFSIYAGPNWSEENKSVNGLTVGFDVGEHKFFTDIAYATEGTHESTIRTNSAGTSLTVNAANGVVHHYGSAGAVDIKAVASSSYHENGTVAFLEVATGRVALEKKAEVTQIHLNATGTGSDAYFNNITIAKAANVELPDFTRDPVEIPAETGKLVVALQESTETGATKDYVWLNAVGVYEQVTVSSSATSAGATYVTDESVSATKKEAAAQIANNITFSDGTEDYKVVATKTGETWTYSVQDSQGQAAAAYEVAASASEITVTKGDNEVATKNDNVLTPDEKAEAKAEVVDELAADEISGEQAAGATYVARIGAKGYESFMDAVAAAKPGEKINIVANTFIIDQNLGSSSDFGLKNKVVLKNDATLIFKNTAKVYMSNDGGFELNGNHLTVVFDSSCNPSQQSGFMNCSLAVAYHGIHTEHWEYSFDNNAATINVDFRGIEDFGSGVGLVYTNQLYIIGGGEPTDGQAFDESVAYYITVNGQQSTNGGYIEAVRANEFAKLYLASGAESYEWKTYTYGMTESEELVKIEEDHGCWAILKGVNNPDPYSIDGTNCWVECTVTESNGDVTIYRWWFKVKNPAGYNFMDDFDWDF